MSVYEIFFIGFGVPFFAMILTFLKRCIAKLKWDKGDIIIALFTIVSLIFLGNVFFQTYSGDWNVDLENYDNVPAYLTFFVTAISAAYLYKTLTAQTKASQIAEFENRFFKFIDFHRDNVNHLEYRNPKREDLHYFKGNQVFTVIYYEIVDLIAEYVEKVGYNRKSRPTADLIDFVYQCVLFGSGKHSKGILTSKFDNVVLNKINFYGRKAKYKSGNKSQPYYSGHQRRLGHYFRNIYQAIQYIEKQNFLSFEQKYEYVAAYRAQMSIYEQAIFFYNSISELGQSWEREKYNRYDIANNDKEKIFKRLWITKYDLIRNTLNNDGIISDGVKITDYYPLINLERKRELYTFGRLPFKKGDGFDICKTCLNTKYYKFPIDEKALKAEVIGEKIITIDEVICSENNCITKRLIREIKGATE